jgi:PAS domain S-box-containing protein
MFRTAWVIGGFSLMTALAWSGSVQEVIQSARLDLLGLSTLTHARVGFSALALTGALGLAGIGIGALKRSTTWRGLRQHEELTRRVWDAVDNGLILVDSSEHVSEWNPAIERLTGVPRRSAVGTVVTRFPLFWHPRHRDCLRLALRGIETASGPMPNQSGKGAATAALRAYYSPLRLSSGDITGVLIVIAPTDISAWRSASDLGSATLATTSAA